MNFELDVLAVSDDQCYSIIHKLSGVQVLMKLLWRMKDMVNIRCCKTTTNTITKLIQGLRRANERRRYFVTTSLTGWVQAKNQPLNNTHSVHNHRHLSYAILTSLKSTWPQTFMKNFQGILWYIKVVSILIPVHIGGVGLVVRYVASRLSVCLFVPLIVHHDPAKFLLVKLFSLFSKST